MKRVFTLLLIVCSTILAANAQKKAQSANANKPTHVVEQLEDIINDYGANGEQVYSVNRNPNTNLLESKVRVVNFRLQKGDFDKYSKADIIKEAYTQDEHLSYSLEHVMMGSKQFYIITDVADDGHTRGTYKIRTFSNQETWIMCIKNQENPRLRDAYAITWQFSPDLKFVDGTVYFITSLRPDLIAKTTNIIPVIPQERVDFSKLTKRPVDTVVATDNDGDIVSIDTIFEDTPVECLETPDSIPVVYSEDIDINPNPVNRIGARDFLNDSQRIQAEMKVQSIKLNRELIKQTFASIKENATGGVTTYKINTSFEQIYKQNKMLDDKYQDFIKYVKKCGMPAREFPNLYKEILTFYTEETKAISELYRNYGTYNKAARKTQSYINSLIEKYMNQMTNSIK